MKTSECESPLLAEVEGQTFTGGEEEVLPETASVEKSSSSSEPQQVPAPALPPLLDPPVRKDVPKFLPSLKRMPELGMADLRANILKTRESIAKKEKLLHKKAKHDDDLLMIRRQRALREAREKLLEKRQVERTQI